ncbi:MAG: LexA family transcriptional regulator [Synergistaceae bacterium]|jgi:transcriptional regulator with XRE-family HTH domain|nr:LexA family transcriptional regulator [Synergistaceae bacterium]
MIGERLKGLRGKYGWTLKRLAEKCGVSTNTVWRWEQNLQVPTIETLERVASELKTTVNFLLDRTDDPLPYLIENEKAGTLMTEDEIIPEHIILVPYLDYPDALENFDKPPAFYKRFDLKIPLISIGKLPTHGYPFLYTVRGDAMAEAGLHDGAMALVNPSEPCNNGDIVLAFVGPRLELFARWCYCLPDGSVELRCPSSNYPVFRFPSEDAPGINIRGKIVGAWNSAFNSSLKRGM